MIHRLYKTDTTDLKQVVRIFLAPGKALDDTEHQPQISVDQFLPCLLVSGAGFF